MFTRAVLNSTRRIQAIRGFLSGPHVFKVDARLAREMRRKDLKLLAAGLCVVGGGAYAIAKYSTSRASAMAVAEAADGNVQGGAAEPLTPPTGMAPHTDAVPNVPKLNPEKFEKYEVTGVYPHTRDSRLIEIAASPEGGEFPTTSFLLSRAQLDGKEVVRPYTPVFSDEKSGLILAVKEYPEGVMSKHICSLKPGDSVELKGPIKKLEYKKNMNKEMVMIAGGSGITPMFQVISKIWEEAGDDTQVTLLYANRSAQQIMLGHMLETLFYFRKSARLVHILEESDDALKQLDHVYTGRINKDILLKYLPDPSADAKILVCGPPGMMEAISGQKAPDKSQGELSGILKELGWSAEKVFKF